MIYNKLLNFIMFQSTYLKKLISLLFHIYIIIHIFLKIHIDILKFH